MIRFFFFFTYIHIRKYFRNEVTVEYLVYFSTSFLFVKRNDN